MEPRLLLQPLPQNHQQRMAPQQQPGLAQSVTEEDDEDLHNALVEEVRSTGGAGDRIALSYLLRYETMVRQQEAEEMATLAHLRPLLERIQVLSGGRSGNNDFSNHNITSFPQSVNIGDDYASLGNEISYQQLKRALEALQIENSPEVMTTDRQLMMMLRLLTQKTTDLTEETISWGELVMMYKLCILGMLTLQHMPATSLSRNRARERTLAMLSLFEPPSTKLFNEGVTLDVEALHASNRGGVTRDVVLQQSTKVISKTRHFALLLLVAMVIGSLGALLPRIELVPVGGLADVFQTVLMSFGPKHAKGTTPLTTTMTTKTNQGSKREVLKSPAVRELLKVTHRETPVVVESPEPSPLIDFFSPVVSHQPSEHVISQTNLPSRQQHHPDRPPLKHLPVARLETDFPSRAALAHPPGTSTTSVITHQLPAALGVVVGAVSVAAVPSVISAVQTMMIALQTSSTFGVVGLWTVTTLLVVSAATKSFQWFWTLLARRWE